MVTYASVSVQIAVNYAPQCSHTNASYALSWFIIIIKSMVSCHHNLDTELCKPICFAGIQLSSPIPNYSLQENIGLLHKQT